MNTVAPFTSAMSPSAMTTSAVSTSLPRLSFPRTTVVQRDELAYGSIELQMQLRALLHSANIGLGLSVLGVLVSVIICYPLEARFTMSELIAGHLSLIVSATLLKICYVGRCIAQYGLQQEVR